MRQEIITLNEERNVTLTAYLQEVEGEFGFARRPAMVVIPGGGYSMCSDREADPVADAYLREGYQAFVLRYSVGEFKTWPNPMEDYEQAMAMIEDRSEEWHIDKGRINIVGFSAGGHLSACAATLAEHKPAAAVLVYPAIEEEIVDMCQPGMPYPYREVTKDTSPCFLAACRDDRTVDIKSTLLMETALNENGIAFESHIYSYGGHGFSTGEDWVVTNSLSERVKDWVPDSIGWLSELQGKLTYKGFTEPTIEPSMNADGAPVLSLNCTVIHLRKQKGEAETLLAPLFEGINKVAEERGYEPETLYYAIRNNTGREILEMIQVDQDTIKALDSALHKLVNVKLPQEEKSNEKAGI